MSGHEDENGREDLKEKITNMARESIHTAGEDASLDNFDLGSIFQAFEQTLKSLMQSVSETIGEYEAAIAEMGGFYAVMKTAWNLEEETVPVLTLESVIAWTKQYFNPAIHSGACLLGSPEDEKYNLLFLDKSNKPILDGSERHKIFYAQRIDHDLKAQLADKQMLILK